MTMHKIALFSALFWWSGNNQTFSFGGTGVPAIFSTQPGASLHFTSHSNQGKRLNMFVPPNLTVYESSFPHRLPLAGHPYFGPNHLASQIWQVLPGQSFEGHSHWRWTLGKANGGGQAFLLAELGIPWGNRSCAIPFFNYKVEYQSTQD